eukprot:2902589-Rhodomonas_salina.1
MQKRRSLVSDTSSVEAPPMKKMVMMMNDDDNDEDDDEKRIIEAHSHAQPATRTCDANSITRD